MLAELLDHDEVTETCRLAGSVGFMALHGGIEEGTAEIATAAAESCGASLYAVRVGSGLWWHVPSTRFDPQESDALAGFVNHVNVVISIHGYGRDELGATVLLGGSNRELAGTQAARLRELTDLAVIDDLDRIPEGLRGLHPANPVNLPKRGGVQVELPPSARRGDTGTQVVTALAAAAAIYEG